MLENDIIEPSDGTKSFSTAPKVLVRKKDITYGSAIDYIGLNAVTCQRCIFVAKHQKHI